MTKAIILLKRRPEIARDAFAEWWLESHRALAEALPGLRRHAFNLLPDGGPFDAIVEQWFDTPEAARSCYEGEVGRRVAADSLDKVAERLRVLVDCWAFDIASVLDTAPLDPS